MTRSAIRRNRLCLLCGLAITGFHLSSSAQAKLDSLRKQLTQNHIWQLTSTRTGDGPTIQTQSQMFLTFNADASGRREETTQNPPDSSRSPATIRLTFNYVVILNGQEAQLQFKRVTCLEGKKEDMVCEPKLDTLKGYRFRFIEASASHPRRLRIDSPYRGEGKPTVHYFFK